MSASKSERIFLDRLITGTESAAGELDNRFRQRLSKLVEMEMDRRYRRREDPEDVVQSVFRTFFRRTAEGEFQIEHPAALWKLLQQITRRKILKHVEYHKAIKRDPDREAYLNADQLPSHSPATAEAHLLGDVLENVLAGMKPPDPEIARLQLYGYTIVEVVEIVLSELESPYSEILQLRLQGNTETQIAEKLCCGREAVRYRLQRICERLSTLLKENIEE